MNVSVAIQGDSLITRIEEKYLFPETSRDFLVSFLSQALAKSAPIRKPVKLPGYTCIESIYFDSPGLQLYRDHFLSGDQRFKLRTRRYGDGEFRPDDAITLELKEKKAGFTVKTRLGIRHEDYLKLIASESIRYSEELQELNPKLSRRELFSRVSGIAEKMGAYDLTPAFKITYRRIAFEQGPIRVTCDEKLQYEGLRGLTNELRSGILGSAVFPPAAQMSELFRRAPVVLLEVKRRGDTPEWLGSFLKGHGVQNVKFSKYCFAVTESLR